MSFFNVDEDKSEPKVIVPTQVELEPPKGMILGRVSELVRRVGKFHQFPKENFVWYVNEAV